MANMRVEASVTFIPDPEAMYQEIMELGELSTREQALDIIRAHFTRLNVIELIPYSELANAVHPQLLIQSTADHIKKELADELLNRTGMINLEQEGEWPMPSS